MDSETIVYCVILFLLGMLLTYIITNVCGCKNVVEGQFGNPLRNTREGDSVLNWARSDERRKVAKNFAGYYTVKDTEGKLTSYERAFNANELARQFNAAGEYMGLDSDNCSKIQTFINRFGPGGEHSIFDTVEKAESAYHCISQTGGLISDTVHSLDACMDDIKDIIKDMGDEVEEGEFMAACSMLPIAGWGLDVIDGGVMLGTAAYGGYKLDEAISDCGDAIPSKENLLHVAHCMSGRTPHICTPHISGVPSKCSDTNSGCNHIKPIPYHPHVPKNYNELMDIWNREESVWDGNLFNSKGQNIKSYHETNDEFFNRVINGKILGIVNYTSGDTILEQIEDNILDEDDGDDLVNYLNQIEEEHQNLVMSEMIIGERDDGLIYYDPYGQYKITARNLINKLPVEWTSDYNTTGPVEDEVWQDASFPNAASNQIINAIQNPQNLNLPAGLIYFKWDPSAEPVEILSKNECEQNTSNCRNIARVTYNYLLDYYNHNYLKRGDFTQLRHQWPPAHALLLQESGGTAVSQQSWPGPERAVYFYDPECSMPVLNFRELIRGPPKFRIPNILWQTPASPGPDSFYYSGIQGYGYSIIASVYTNFKMIRLYQDNHDVNFGYYDLCNDQTDVNIWACNTSASGWTQPDDVSEIIYPNQTRNIASTEYCNQNLNYCNDDTNTFIRVSCPTACDNIGQTPVQNPPPSESEYYGDNGAS